MGWLTAGRNGRIGQGLRLWWAGWKACSYSELRLERGVRTTFLRTMGGHWVRGRKERERSVSSVGKSSLL